MLYWISYSSEIKSSSTEISRYYFCRSLACCAHFSHASILTVVDVDYDSRTTSSMFCMFPTNPLAEHICSCSVWKSVKLRTRADMTPMLYRAPVPLHPHFPHVSVAFVMTLPTSLSSHGLLTQPKAVTWRRASNAVRLNVFGQFFYIMFTITLSHIIISRYP